MSFNFPDPPLTVGQQVTNAATGIMYQWDGVRWLPVAVPLPSGVTVTVSDTAPATPKPADLWFDSVGAQTYLYYQDPSSTQWVLTTSPPFPAAASFSGNVGRNFVHNAQFNIAQRGSGNWTTSGAYTADRWKMGFNLDTLTVSRAAFVVGGATGIEEAAYYLNYVVTGNAGAASYSFICQPIEGVRRLGAKTVTVSFWATAASGSPKIGVSFDQQTGTGGSPSAVGIGNGQSVTLGQGWTRYSLTFALPSMTGATLGTNGDDYTNLNFWLSSGTNQAARAGNIGVQSASVGLYGVQLEIGSGYGFPTPLEKIDPADDLRRCQRFYEVITVGQDYSGGLSLTYIMRTYGFTVTKRVGPAVTMANMQYYSNGQPTAMPSPTVYNAAVNLASVGSSGLTNAQGLAGGQIMASADL